MTDITNLEKIIIEKNKQEILLSPTTQEMRELTRILSICMGYDSIKMPDELIAVSFADLILERLEDLESFLSYDLYLEGGEYLLQFEARGELDLRPLPIKDSSSIITLQDEFGLKPLGAIMGINYATIKYFVDTYNGSTTSFFPSREEMRKNAISSNNQRALRFFRDVPNLQFPRMNANSNYPSFYMHK